MFAVVVDAESEVTVANLISNAKLPDTLVPDAGLTTESCTVSTEAISAAGTVAINSIGFPEVALTYVVGN